MSYIPESSPLIFAYNPSNQITSQATNLRLTSNLYAGYLSSAASTNTELNVAGNVSLMGDVLYSNTAGGGFRGTTYIQNNNVNSPSRGYNIDGDGSGNKGVCDDISYSVSNAAIYEIYTNPKSTISHTYEANYTRLSGIRVTI
jgi:hypothetical protein